MSRLGVSAALAASLMCCVAWAADAPFVGAWKLDPAKSRLTDRMQVESLGGNRYAFDFGVGTETVSADGSDQPGYGGTTLAVTLGGPDALKVVRKKGGHVLLEADWRLSRDGRSLTDDFTSFAPDGAASKLKYVYGRTAGTAGFAGTWESTSVAVDFSLLLKIQPYAADGLSIISPAADKPKDLRFDGRDYPNLSSNAARGTTYSARRSGELSLEITDKLDGKLADTQQYQLSSDLKTLTLTVHKPGMRAPSVFVFERQ
ncbi:MAG TPA: hypothetical protein VGH71_03980 [Gammaproteobacteria bacterium]|jgi:hypothetical protein